MARIARSDVFSPDEVAIVHLLNRTVRKCFLLGDDPATGRNFDHRKQWIEDELKRLAGQFGIDLLGFAILSNHFHLILRSRPDVVQAWDDTEVARRWLMLCPYRKDTDGHAAEPVECELNSIRHDPDRLAEIRSRLSDISWWMRLLSQKIAIRANRDDHETGKFWQARFRAVRIVDEEALLACAAYVDLNPIRAAMAQTLEESDYTSVQRRIQAEQQGAENAAKSDTATGDARNASAPGSQRADASFLAPLALEEQNGEIGPRVHRGVSRCSDKGFLPISTCEYLELLDWTARQVVPGKRGVTPQDTPSVLERLHLSQSSWCELVRDFGRLFSTVAGHPRTIDGSRTRSGRRTRLTPRVRKLLPTKT